MVFFIPWRVVAEESGAAHFGSSPPSPPSSHDGQTGTEAAIAFRSSQFE
jgi:hypothetical protein